MIELSYPARQASGPWSDLELRRLREAYAAGDAVANIAEALGRSGPAVRNKAYEMKITTRDDGWSDAEIAEMRAAYALAVRRGDLDLEGLSRRLSRSKPSISRKAKTLGLTNAARPAIKKPKVDRRKYKSDAERSAALSERMRAQHKANGHPMAGKSHTDEARKVIAAKSRQNWKSKSGSERAAWTDAMLRGRLENQGTLVKPRPNATWKAGWREIGETRKYYRSRWEANYARYLEWLRLRGEIRDWRHEPETFWFDGIKRGVRSYLPDFRVWNNDETTALHEVKGWMDTRSKTTLRRMAKYHPGETIIVIREKQYNEIARKIGPMIVGWESGGRADRP